MGAVYSQDQRQKVKGARKMIDTRTIETRYNKLDEDSRALHQNPEKMTNGRLLAELDDVVQMLVGASNVEWANLHETAAGRAYLRMRREVASRVYAGNQEQTKA